MQFVSNLNNLILDDQYFLDVTVEDSNASAPTGNIGLVGTFSKGPLNTPVLVTSYPDLVNKFGDISTGLTGALAARGIYNQGNVNVYVVRIESSTTKSKAAFLDLKDATAATVLTLTAKTTGTWGNDIKVNVVDGTKTGTFQLVLQYGSTTETYDNLLVAQPETPIDGAVLVADVLGTNGKSNLVTASFPTTPNTNNVATSDKPFSLAQGVDGGDNVKPTDYIGASNAGLKTGLYALDSAPINFILAAEQGDAQINDALMTNAQSITNNGGLPRIAVITFPEDTKVDDLAGLTSKLDSDRVIAVYPWVQVSVAGSPNPQVVAPHSFLAGVLAQLSPHLSPGNKQVFGTLGLDPTQNIGPSELITMVKARVNTLGIPTPAGQIGIRGGITLSTKDDSSQVYVRRMRDYIDQLVFSVGGRFVDQPITDDVMRHVYQSVDNILQPMKSPVIPTDQMIADYKVVCDASNNPPESIAQNRLICDYAVKLLNVNRFMIFRTQIGAGTVITKQS